MNKDIMMDTDGTTTSDMTTTTSHHHHQQQNPRKKQRTKVIRLGHDHITKPVKCAKKPDPGAPNITPPCTECGKRFWSWKALFGHMRCHPERSWRGINPPPNLNHSYYHHHFTEDDRYVASCLLMLANGTPPPHTTIASTSHHHHQEVPMGAEFFECSSCKKVFGSHQALGGHRASHKNVKGCFAIARNNNNEDELLEEGELLHNNDNMVMVLGSSQHMCSICLKVFSSGQALGGHKRCHWEKEDVVVQSASTSNVRSPPPFDLNLPAPLQDDDDSSSSSLALDLRLGL